MLLEAHRNRTNKKAKRLNFHKGRQSRSPSQTNGDAKIQINVETAIQKLREIAQKYIGVSNPYGFLTDLRTALGIPNKQGASKYGEVTIPRNDGSVLQASLRITNHQANAGTYITHNANCEYNLSIVVRKTRRRNTFKPHDDVRLDEFVYYGKNIAKVENPLTQIVNSIIGFLQTGNYIDTTGVALKNTSPQTNNSNQKNINCNINMKTNRKIVRLTESDLHRIVEESVNRLLNEIGDTQRGQNLIGQTAARAIHRKDFDTVFDAHDRRSREDDSNFIRGHNDRLYMINKPEIPSPFHYSEEGRRARMRMQNNYEVAEMEDMDAIGRKFIDFIENHRGGMMMQTIVEYESGNYTGTPESGFPAVLEVFEDEVLGYDCSPKIEKALKSAYNQWWYYAESQLMPEED